MAENTQTFILVGDFKDNITPKLTKLNREIEALTKNFNKISTKLRPISKEFGNMAAASERMANALKSQRGAFDSNSRAMTNYRREVGKLRAAHDQLAKSQQRAARGVGRGSTAGLPPMGGGGGGGRGGMAAAAGGFVAGEGIANMMTGAIVKGFRMGVGLMMKPFQYGATAIGERIQDEMSDIKSAGGMFAVDRRENMGIFKDLSAARRFQEELNAKLAQSAAALPGETAEYVQQAKQLTDTVMLSLAKNQGEFIKFAKELDPAVKSSTDAMATVLQQFTEKAVLLGQGESSGIYGVPQILEMLVSQEQVNVKAFNRFGAYMRNPLLKNALQNAEGELKKTAANTADRFRVIQKVLNEAVPNEVVMDMTNSAEGIIQAIKSGFLDPESGLLGLGRKLNIALPRVDSLGYYINDAGERVATAAEAAKDAASVFEVLKSTIGGLVLPLAGIIDILPEIYEPLSGLATGFMDLRDISQQFYKAFNSYTKYYEKEANKFAEMAQKAGDAGRKDEAEALSKKSQAIAKRAKLGGTLNALNDLLVAFGTIDEKQYSLNAKKLMDIESVNPAEMVKTMLSQLMGSDFMTMVGEAIGGFVGTVLKAVGDLMAGVNSIAEAGPFAKGLQKGFQKAKGGQGIALVFKNLFSLIGKALMTLFKSAPLEMSILSALTVGMPLLQGAIVQGMMKMFGAISSSVGTMGLTGGIGGMGATISGWLGAVGPALGLIAKVLPPIAAAMAAIVFLGGGVENTLRQLQQIFGEIGHTLWGSFSGLADVIGTLMGFIGDLANGIARMFNAISGTNTQLDLLKVLLFPITGALQALEIGLLGLNVVLTKVRSWMANWLGTEEEKKAAYQTSVDADVNMRQAQGRQNAYNMSMQGPEVLKKAMNNAVYEINNSKTLKASRSAELKAFIAEAKAQLGQKPTAAPTPGAPTLPKPGAPTAATPAPVAPAATLAPVTTAVQQGTTATQAVNSSTQGVRTAVQQATAATQVTAKEIAGVSQKKFDLMIVGLNAVKSALMAISSKVSTQPTLSQVNANTNETNNLLRQLNATMKASSMMPFGMGGFSPPLGGAQGSLGQAARMASASGLQVTSSFRPGDPGYHGVGRAMDFSNSTGPTPQMMAFAQQMIAQYGSSLTELIYSPLGFSIKNGQKVAPLAYGSHFNHVHVAFAHGLENPRLFSSAQAAQAYEGMYAPASAQVKTITANSSENLGGTYNVTQNISISGADDPRRLAEMVFNYAAQAAEHINNSSFA